MPTPREMERDQHAPRLRPTRLLPVLLLLATACNTVEFYEKEALSSRVMQLEGQRTLETFEQKVFFSTEGAAGGLGTTAGGGCGCY